MESILFLQTPQDLFRYFDFATKQIRPVFDADNDFGPGMSISPVDAGSIYTVRRTQTATSCSSTIFVRVRHLFDQATDHGNGPDSSQIENQYASAFQASAPCIKCQHRLPDHPVRKI